MATYVLSVTEVEARLAKGWTLQHALGRSEARPVFLVVTEAYASAAPEELEARLAELGETVASICKRRGSVFFLSTSETHARTYGLDEIEIYLSGGKTLASIFGEPDSVQSRRWRARWHGVRHAEDERAIKFIDQWLASKGYPTLDVLLATQFRDGAGRWEASNGVASMRG